MADNVSLTAGDGTITAGADVIAGVAYPRVKLELGADGTVVDAVGGSGVNSTAVQRVTIATDDVIIASLATKLDTLITATDTVETKLQAIADDIVSATITTVAHDAAASSVNPILQGGYASAAAPSDVSADTDAVRAWRLRNGAAATVITAAGALVGGDATNGLDVDVTRLPALVAGEAHIAEVGGNTVVKTITMTADTSIMASADIIADTQQLDAAFRKTDGTGVLQSLTVFDPDDNAAFAFDVYIHSTSTSMGSENSAVSISDANAAAGIIGVVHFATTDYFDLINGGMYHKANLGLPVYAVSGTDDLYFSIRNGAGTPTFAGGNIPIRVGLLRD